MAQQFSRDQAAVLLGSAISEVWDTLGDAKDDLIYPKYTQDISDPHPKHITDQFAYPSQVSQKNEGEPLTYGSLKVGTILSLDPITFSLGVRFTMEALEDMARQGFGTGQMNAKLVAAGKIGQAFRKAVAQKRELLCTELISLADSTTATNTYQGTGWDAKALWSATHPILQDTSVLGGTTFSNLGAASTLSQSTLQTLISTLETIPTLDGFVRPLGKTYTLVVGPSLRHTAYTAVETAKINKLTGTFDNDIPGLSDFSINVVVNPYLGSSSTRYVLLGPEHKLGYWNYRDSELEDEKDFETKGHRYSVTFRGRSVHDGAYDVIGSVGA